MRKARMNVTETSESAVHTDVFDFLYSIEI